MQTINLTKTFACAIAVFAVTAVIAFFGYNLDTSHRLEVPISYGHGDAPWMLNLLEAASAGELKPFRQFIRIELNAPYSANYSDWPTGIAIEMQPSGWMIGLFGLGVGSNLYLILCHMAAGLSMFICLSILRCQAPWASVFGIAFGLCPYLFHRSFDHITLLNTAFIVPISCIAISLIFTKNPIDTKPHFFLIILLFSFLMGMQNPYYSSPYLWALCLAGVYWWIKIRKMKYLVLYLIFSSIFAIGFIIANYHTLIQVINDGKNFQSVLRVYSDLQVAALRPVEMFLPGSDSGVPILNKISAFYENQSFFPKKVVYYESMSAYLGILGCIGFILLVGQTALRIFSNEKYFISGWFWFALFLLAFSVVGGLNGFIGLGKFYYLRATNRYSIYLIAISIIFFASLLSSQKGFFMKRIRLSLVAMVLLVACAEPLLPRLHGSTGLRSEFAKFKSDRKFAADLEKYLPLGAMVFNFPVIELPERGTYAYFRPTFFTEKIRYSFGSLVGRARETWQPEVEKLPMNQMVQRLKEYGFSGVLIYRGEDLSDEKMASANQASQFFRDNTTFSIISPAGDFEFFAFDPNSNPVFPPVQPMFLNHWWEVAIQPAVFTMNSDYKELRLRWSSHASAMVEVFNEQTFPRRFSLRGKALGITEAELQVYVKQKMVFSGKISPNTPLEFSTDPIQISGHKALRFEFRTDQKPIVRDGRKFSFAVAELETTWE